MVLPVSAERVKRIGTLDPTNTVRFMERRWYTQAKPYTLSLNATYWWIGPLEHSDASRASTCQDFYNRWLSEGGVEYARAYAQAYGNFVDQLGEKSSWGIAISQWRQADDMISRRGYQMWQFARAVNRFDFLGALEHLGIKRRRLSTGQRRKVKRWEKTKDAGSLWLEYNWGWKPLVQDMHSGLVTLCSDPFDVRKIVGRGKAVRTFDDRPPPFSKGMAGSVRTGVHLHARVKIRNFNTYLANQLGLLNPADVIFDAIKFSYALNWVSNAQQVLQSWTDFAGLDVLDPVTTRKYSGAARTYWGSYPWVTSAKSIVYWNRSVGGSFAPPFVWKRFGWTPIRAANVISLLSQELYKTANRPGLK